MGKIKIVTSPKDLPDCLDKHVANSFVSGDDLKEYGVASISDFLNELLKVGGNFNTGREIISAIEDAKVDIQIVPILSGSAGSQFEPEIPGVIFDFMESVYVPSDDPKPMRKSVVLFHELGHAVQWLTRRSWFDKAKPIEIETDNLIRHEWPLSKQMGVPTRMHYDDSSSTPEKALKTWQKQTKAATIIQRAWRNKKRHK